jgi:hypothetical protein
MPERKLTRREVLTAVAMALLLYYGGLRTLSGTLTVGVLAAFIQLTRRFFQPKKTVLSGNPVRRGLVQNDNVRRRGARSRSPIASPIQTPGVSCSSPHGFATDVAGSAPIRQLPI